MIYERFEVAIGRRGFLVIDNQNNRKIVRQKIVAYEDARQLAEAMNKERDSCN
jgi:hypothetical protein